MNCMYGCKLVFKIYKEQEGGGQKAEFYVHSNYLPLALLLQHVDWVKKSLNI